MAELRKPGVRALTLWTLGGVGVLLLVLFALLVGPWLFTKNTERLNPDQRLKAENDARTTLVQALAGLAVAGGLIVTYRTYRQNQVEQDRTYRQRQAEQDRTYERELFATAVEQLGHDNAPVRLGALYSLESLAQDHPHRRQTVVDVLCAYLRMPYTSPTEGDLSALPDASREPPHARNSAQELQVRQTAQRRLAIHLRRPANTSGADAQRLPQSPAESFWPGISLDLTGATLVELELQSASVVAAIFKGARFTGAARFRGATFNGVAEFSGATFTGVAEFSWTSFTDVALFYGATFTSDGGFYGATFTYAAYFDDVTFTYAAYFDDVTFTGAAWFSRATFTSSARFSGATFTGAARFHGATFSGAAGFNQATFTGAALFSEATFTVDVSFDSATVLHLDDLRPNERLWPHGWTVRPNPADPSSGLLECVEEDRERSRTPPA
jgi:uncharacterized protein YjbI with pentapeptide repeats